MYRGRGHARGAWRSDNQFDRAQYQRSQSFSRHGENRSCRNVRQFDPRCYVDRYRGASYHVNPRMRPHVRARQDELYNDDFSDYMMSFEPSNHGETPLPGNAEQRRRCDMASEAVLARHSMVAQIDAEIHRLDTAFANYARRFHERKSLLEDERSKKRTKRREKERRKRSKEPRTCERITTASKLVEEKIAAELVEKEDEEKESIHSSSSRRSRTLSTANEAEKLLERAHDTAEPVNDQSTEKLVDAITDEANGQPKTLEQHGRESGELSTSAEVGNTEVEAPDTPDRSDGSDRSDRNEVDSEIDELELSELDWSFRRMQMGLRHQVTMATDDVMTSLEGRMADVTTEPPRMDVLTNNERSEVGKALENFLQGEEELSSYTVKPSEGEIRTVRLVEMNNSWKRGKLRPLNRREPMNRSGSDRPRDGEQILVVASRRELDDKIDFVVKEAQEEAEKDLNRAVYLGTPLFNAWTSNAYRTGTGRTADAFSEAAILRHEARAYVSDELSAGLADVCGVDDSDWRLDMPKIDGRATPCAFMPNDETRSSIVASLVDKPGIVPYDSDEGVEDDTDVEDECTNGLIEPSPRSETTVGIDRNERNEAVAAIVKSILGKDKRETLTSKETRKEETSSVVIDANMKRAPFNIPLPPEPRRKLKEIMIAQAQTSGWTSVATRPCSKKTKRSPKSVKLDGEASKDKTSKRHRGSGQASPPRDTLPSEYLSSLQQWAASYALSMNLQQCASFWRPGQSEPNVPNETDFAPEESPASAMPSCGGTNLQQQQVELAEPSIYDPLPYTSHLVNDMVGYTDFTSSSIAEPLHGPTQHSTVDLGQFHQQHLHLGEDQFGEFYPEQEALFQAAGHRTEFLTDHERRQIFSQEIEAQTREFEAPYQSGPFADSDVRSGFRPRARMDTAFGHDSQSARVHDGRVPRGRNRMYSPPAQYLSMRPRALTHRPKPARQSEQPSAVGYDAYLQNSAPNSALPEDISMIDLASRNENEPSLEQFRYEEIRIQSELVREKHSGPQVFDQISEKSPKENITQPTESDVPVFTLPTEKENSLPPITTTDDSRTANANEAFTQEKEEQVDSGMENTESSHQLRETSERVDSMELELTKVDDRLLIEGESQEEVQVQSDESSNRAEIDEEPSVDTKDSSPFMTDENAKDEDVDRTTSERSESEIPPAEVEESVPPSPPIEIGVEGIERGSETGMSPENPSLTRGEDSIPGPSLGGNDCLVSDSVSDSVSKEGGRFVTKRVEDIFRDVCSTTFKSTEGAIPGIGDGEVVQLSTPDMADGSSMTEGSSRLDGSNMADGSGMADGYKISDESKMADEFKKADGSNMAKESNMADGSNMAGEFEMADGSSMVVESNNMTDGSDMADESCMANGSNTADGSNMAAALQSADQSNEKADSPSNTEKETILPEENTSDRGNHEDSEASRQEVSSTVTMATERLLGESDDLSAGSETSGVLPEISESESSRIVSKETENVSQTEIEDEIDDETFPMDEPLNSVNPTDSERAEIEDEALLKADPPKTIFESIVHSDVRISDVEISPEGKTKPISRMNVSPVTLRSSENDDTNADHGSADSSFDNSSDLVQLQNNASWWEPKSSEPVSDSSPTSRDLSNEFNSTVTEKLDLDLHRNSSQKPEAVEGGADAELVTTETEHDTSTTKIESRVGEMFSYVEREMTRSKLVRTIITETSLIVNDNYWEEMESEDDLRKKALESLRSKSEPGRADADLVVAMETDDGRVDPSQFDPTMDAIIDPKLSRDTGVQESASSTASTPAVKMTPGGITARSEEASHSPESTSVSPVPMTDLSEKRTEKIENIFEALKRPVRDEGRIEDDSVSLSDILLKQKLTLGKSVVSQNEMLENLTISEPSSSVEKKKKGSFEQSKPEPVSAPFGWPVFDPSRFRIPKKKNKVSTPALRRSSSDSTNGGRRVTDASATSPRTTLDQDNSPDDIPGSHLTASAECVTSGRDVTTANDVDIEDCDVMMDDDDDDDLPDFSKMAWKTMDSREIYDIREPDNLPTPTRVNQSTSDLESPVVKRLTTPTRTATATDVFSLETLHAEKQEQMSEGGQLYSMKEKTSKEKIKKGGFRQIVADCENIDEVDVELTDQLEGQLKKLKNDDVTIQTWPPGDVRFQAELRGRYFDAGLSLAQCGFKQGSSRVDKYLATSSSDQLKTLIKGDILCIGFARISCKEAFLLWLFNIVSVHDEEDVVRDAHRLMYHIIADCGMNWVPSVQDVTRVFLNYGASLSDLYPSVCELEFSEVDLELSEPNREETALPRSPAAPRDEHCLKFLNLQCVVQSISICCQKCWHLYSTNDLKLLIVLVCRVALDTKVIKGVVRYDTEICLQELIDKFEENGWNDIMYELCLLLTNVTQHHHNRMQLAKLMPPTSRGMQLQRRLAYTLLLATMPDETSSVNRSVPTRKEIANFRVSSLIHVISQLLTIQILPTTYYRLASMVQLIDLAVGNEALAERERSTLVALEKYLRQLTSCVRDDCHNLDTSTIKDLIQRTISKWTFLLRDMGRTQNTLFDHYSIAESVRAPPGCVELDSHRSEEEEIECSESGHKADQDQGQFLSSN